MIIRKKHQISTIIIVGIPRYFFYDMSKYLDNYLSNSDDWKISNFVKNEKNEGPIK